MSGGAGESLIAEILAHPLGDVIAARDEVVRRLRREKRTAEAAEIARVRRPSPALWAVDRLHDVDPVALHELLDAGTDVRSAQAALLAGDRDAVQRVTGAAERFNAAVRRSAEAAMRLLGEEGHGAGAETERRLQSMLRAVAVGDDEMRAAILDGRLVAEPQPAGFDMLAGAPLGARPAVEAAPRSQQADVPAGRQRRLELQRAVGERRDAHARAEREAAARRSRVATLAKELAEVERRVTSLQRELEAERKEAATAEAAAREAQAALDRARAALDS